MNFFRIKTEWTEEKADGSLQKVKTEELVLASSYTEAEQIAHSLIESENREQFGDVNVEILKTKISEVAYNNVLTTSSNTVHGLICSFFEEKEDTGVGLYAVKVLYMEIDERTGKEKKSSDTLYVPATSNADATIFTHKYLKAMGESRMFVIRDVKFDRAEAILWEADIYQNKTKMFDLMSA